MFSVKQGDDLHIVFDKESLQLIGLFAIAKSTVNSANILIQRPQFQIGLQIDTFVYTSYSKIPQSRCISAVALFRANYIVHLHSNYHTVWNL